MTDIPTGARARKPISKGLRFDVLSRDGFKCTYCGAAPPDVVLHLDHFVPFSKGGEDTLANLRTACLACNIGKGAKMGFPQPKAKPPEGTHSFNVRPRVEFFWANELQKPHRMVKARCVEWLDKAQPFGGWEYSKLCRDVRFSTHGHSTRGFSPYEAAMYAVEILSNDWVRFADYVAYIDDLNLMAEAGHLPQYIAPHVLRALHAQTVYSRCAEKPTEYEEIADSIAKQSAAAFEPFIASQHTLWKDAL